MRMQLHEAIRAAYQGRVTQDQIARALDVDQPTVSRWARGTNRPSIEQIAGLEDAAGRPRGWVLRHLGLVTEEVTTELAIANDTRLSDPNREILLQLYRTLTQAGQ